MKSQGDSSFPADGHKAILNKMNNKSKTNRDIEWTIRTNHSKSTALERSVIITGGGGLNRFYERITSPWVLL